MAKKLLIAAVVVTCYVDGVRTDIQPGEPVPDLSPHDEEQLKRMRAVIDQAEEARQEKADARVADTVNAEFQAARESVAAANASLGDPPQADQVGTEAPAAAAKTAAAKKAATKPTKA